MQTPNEKKVGGKYMCIFFTTTISKKFVKVKKKIRNSKLTVNKTNALLYFLSKTYAETKTKVSSFVSLLASVACKTKAFVTGENQNNY